MHRNRSPQKSSKKYVLLFIVLIIVGYWRFFSATPPHEVTDIKVDKGESLDSLSATLYKEGVIRSPLAFRIMARLKGVDRNIKSGLHKFEERKSLTDVLDTLTISTETQTKITIPEGYSVYDIDKVLTEKELIKAGEFIESAQAQEGFLFPDTYFVFTQDFSPDDLISKMNENYESKMSELSSEFASNGRSVQEIITMASILEKEVRTEKDLATVSGILWKRLDNNWALQTDATLLYGKKDNRISTADLQSNSPYNTRKFRGLPPSPIGNPGLATIKAAISPAPSPYWFYLTDSDGTVYYAETNEEHNINKRKYL